MPLDRARELPLIWVPDAESITKRKLYEYHHFMMGSVGQVTPLGHPMRSNFLFDTKYTNLNHGRYFPLDTN